MVRVHRHVTQGELMLGNQGICSHASPECRSLMHLLRECLTLETPVRVVPQQGQRCWPRGTLVLNS